MLSPPKTFTYKTTAEGLDLNLDIYAPSAATNTVTPFILYFHIGGLLFGSRDDALFPKWLAKAITDSGWTFISADYRLLPEANIVNTLSDIDSAWSFLHNNFNDLTDNRTPRIDTTRGFVVGASAGGYLALQAGHMFQNPRPQGIVSLYGFVFDDSDFFSTPHHPNETMGGLPFSVAFNRADEIDELLKGKKHISGKPFDPSWTTRELLLPYLIGTGQYTQQVFNVSSPSADPFLSHLFPQYNITSSYPPTLLVHGLSDTIAPASESILMADKLEDAEVDVELILVDGAEHIFDQTEGKVADRVRGEVLDWLRNHAEVDVGDALE